jgi:enterochelin esterase family protein
MLTAIGKAERLQLNLHTNLLQRDVKIDLFLPPFCKSGQSYPLLILNDGQDMTNLNMLEILNTLYTSSEIQYIVVAAVHAGNRLQEYGTASEPDYLRRGSKAGTYQQFIIQELLPHLRKFMEIDYFKSRAFAGFSLGGLAALDIVWNYPHLFHTCGVFSGSLWWRKKQFDPRFPDSYRIIHEHIDYGGYHPHQRFWFQCGTEDEAEDRNNNGIIDSIDDTLDLIRILKKKGYREPYDVYYHEISGGRHDVRTWAKAMPFFLKWAYGRNQNQ